MPADRRETTEGGPLEVWLVYGDRRVEGGWQYFGGTPVPPGDLINVRDIRSGDQHDADSGVWRPPVEDLHPQVVAAITPMNESE